MIPPKGAVHPSWSTASSTPHSLTQAHTQSPTHHTCSRPGRAGLNMGTYIIHAPHTPRLAYIQPPTAAPATQAAAASRQVAGGRPSHPVRERAGGQPLHAGLTQASAALWLLQSTGPCPLLLPPTQPQPGQTTHQQLLAPTPHPCSPLHHCLSIPWRGLAGAAASQWACCLLLLLLPPPAC
jgi:hypothetical protein